jgi:tetratricopeptide (TPR) repeat protein
MTDWYRRTTWTATDEEEFFAKLSRARKNSRAQYLRIQAVALCHTNKKEFLSAAEILLNKILDEYSENKPEQSTVLYLLGGIRRRFEDYETALRYFEEALEFEREYPNVTTDAYWDYSELVIMTGKIEMFDKIEIMLLERYSAILFPIDKYKINSILSIISKQKNEPEKARHYAELAEQNANAEISGLRYHKYLGVVKERIEWLDTLVQTR